MKNIFTLPTPNPSELYKNINGELGYTKNFFIQNDGFNDNQQIYITNDEVIKTGDWCMSLCDDESFEEIYKCEDVDLVDEEDKKIIFTKDPILIKDGVETIPDNFIEWFLQNQTCESIEVKKNCCGECDERLCEIHDLQREETKYNTFYKLIIPKHETLSEKLDKIVSKEPSKFWAESDERIKSKEITYTADEVLGFLHDYEAFKFNSSVPVNIDVWFHKNKKRK